MKTLFFLLMGTAFGWIISRSGVSDYDAVTGMFLLTDFQLYGVIGAAIGVLVPGLWIAKRRAKTIRGEAFTVKAKPLHKGTVIGSVLFGVGWAITGICPGPVFVSIGEGKLYGLVMLAGVLAGTALFGVAHPKLSWLQRVAQPKSPDAKSG